VLRASLADIAELSKNPLELRPATATAASGLAQRGELVDGLGARTNCGVDGAIGDCSTAADDHVLSVRSLDVALWAGFDAAGYTGLDQRVGSSQRNADGAWQAVGDAGDLCGRSVLVDDQSNKIHATKTERGDR
jgi:hypothetical protein